MDAHDEKKWFVYLGDHHEGPYTVAEIQTQMAGGHVTAANYVWCDGMGDWQLMSDVAAFAAAAQPAFKQASGGGFAESVNPALAPPLEAVPVESAMPASVTPIESIGMPEPAVAYPDSASPVEAEPVAPSSALATEEPSLEFVSPQAVAEPVMPEASVSLSTPVREQSFSRAADPNTGRVSRVTVAQSDRVALDAPAPAIGSAVDAMEHENSKHVPVIARLRGALHILGKFVVPVLTIAVLGGVAFGYTSGYFDPLLANPAVRAFTRTIGDASRPYLLKAADKFPALQGLVSPIPHFDDMAELDYQQLRDAATHGPTSGGARVAMALSTDSAAGPSFYAAGNVPDGTHLEIHLYGIPDTLLNQLSFSGGDTLTIAKRFGKSAVVHAADGKPIPKGQYIAMLIEAADDLPASKAALTGVPTARVPEYIPADFLPKGAKPLAVGSFFLGGAKDATYDARLKEFHAKLAAHAVDELREVHQFADTLQSQLDTTVRNFASTTKTPKGLPIVGKIPPAKLKNWDAFDKQWMQLSGSLSQSFGKWTPDMLEHEYFYGMLYQLTQQAGQAVDLVHKIQQSYLAPNADRTQLDGQLTQVGALAASTLANLRAKVEQAEKLPLTANGMPRRDGL